MYTCIDPQVWNELEMTKSSRLIKIDENIAIISTTYIFMQSLQTSQ